MNTYQTQIAQIFDSAQSSIQVAVSWFTDEYLIEKLIKKAKNVKIEVLLSADEVNVLRYSHFRQLQSIGAKVRKLGAENALDGNFTHSKLIIIDERIAYGGSYNFTVNAKTNNENFGEYKYFNQFYNDFKSWFANSIDFFHGISNPEEIVRRLKQKFLENEKQRINWFEKSFGFPEFSEEKYEVLKEEVKKDNLRNEVKAFEQKESALNNQGYFEKNTQGVYDKPNRNYGGTSFSNQYDGKKLPNSYALALYQKRVIEKNYTFLKCRIENDILICVGEVQPDNCEKYKIRIEFRAGHHPRVFILSPKIEIRPEIHIYREGYLCLFYPPDMKWKDTTKIAEYTIPWTIKWIVYYELWKLTGKWEGAEKLHKPLRPVRKNNSI